MFLHFRLELSAEKRLVRKLVRNYTALGRNGRPVKDVNKTVSVEFGLGLIQMDLDEKSKVLKMSMWSKYVSITRISLFLEHLMDVMLRSLGLIAAYDNYCERKIRW